MDRKEEQKGKKEEEKGVGVSEEGIRGISGDGRGLDLGW